MKKVLATILAVALVVTFSFTVTATDSGETVYKWNAENLLTTGDFEAITFADDATQIDLPRFNQDTVLSADLGYTGGWFSNEFDLIAAIVKGEGVDGGNAIKFAGDGFGIFGAAYWKLPRTELADKDVITVSFMYKISDALKAGTPQIHAHIIGNNVYAAGDAVAVIKDDPYVAITPEVCGFTDYVGTDMGDGWYKVTGSVACEALGDRTFLRLFVDFRQPIGALGSDAYILFDNIEVGVASLTVNEQAAENLSSENLIQGGDFEERALGEQLGTDYDEYGWGSTIWDKDTTSVKRDADGNKYLAIAGTGANAYGLANCRMPALTAGNTYRLSFDYKFIAETADITWQAHASICTNPAKQAGNPGGWYNVNLTEKPGQVLSNGYTRVTFDFTPSAFEIEAMTDLRFFVQLGNAANDFGICIDNVTLYDIAEADPLPEAVQDVIEQIDALGDVDDLTADDKEAVKATKDAYDALSAADAAKVPIGKVNLLNAAYEKLFTTSGGSNDTDDEQQNPDIPQTGDNSGIVYAVCVCMMFISLGGIVFFKIKQCKE